jgi:hypothetical protein
MTRQFARTLALLAFPLMAAGTAFAQDATTAAPTTEATAVATPAMQKACEAHPDRCAAAKAKMQEKCAADPTSCDARKAKLEERLAKRQGTTTTAPATTAPQQ